MADLNSPESFKALYADLVDLSEAKLSDPERLQLQIEAHIPAFKSLLDKRTRNEESRKSLATGIKLQICNIRAGLIWEVVGKLDVDGEQYEINEEFQAASLRLADDLNIDELDAARLFLDSQGDTSGQPAHTAAIVRFHQRRKYLLDCLHKITQTSADVDKEEDVRGVLKAFVKMIIDSESTTRYAQKCVSSMGDIKTWLQSLADKVNGASVLGQSHQPDFLETIQFQQASLVNQHESLGLIMLWLVKLEHAEMTDFDLVLDTLKKADRYDNLLCKGDSTEFILAILCSDINL